MSQRVRAIFMGTPAFAVDALAALADVADIVGVVCQPDKPAGRGLHPSSPAVKREATARGWEIVQPTKVRDGTLATWILERQPDVALVVAYGRILPADVLAAPRLGCVNVHASVLPRHRGAAPIAWAILAGDRQTGVTLMQMDEGMDTGPILATRVTDIGPDEAADQLAQRLARMGAEVVRDELPNYVAGALKPVPQSSSGATAAPTLTKEMSSIDWKKPSAEIHAQVRGLHPWPGASSVLGTRRIILHHTTRDDAPTLHAGAPGEVVAVTKDRVWVATGSGAIGLLEVQFEGRKRMEMRAFLAGHPLRPGMMFGG